MLLKRYVLGITQIFHRESRKKKKPELVSTDSESYASSVRIVLPGGLVELYHGAIPAGHVLKKYPLFCVARPEVFKRPCESEVGAEEELLPGQKFYLVPRTTMKKLRKHCATEEASRANERCCEESEGSMVWSGWSYSGESGEESGGDEGERWDCSAKDFYVSKEKWSKCLLRRWGIGGNEEKKIFTFRPPIKVERMWARPAWQPGLPSVTEVSP